MCRHSSVKKILVVIARWLEKQILEHRNNPQRKVNPAHNTESAGKTELQLIHHFVLWPLLNPLANSVLLNHNDRPKYKCQDFAMFPVFYHITITILYSLPGDTLEDLEAFNLIWLAAHKQLELCQEQRPDYVNETAWSTREFSWVCGSSGNLHELALCAPRGNFLWKQTSEAARGNCFPLEPGLAGNCVT